MIYKPSTYVVLSHVGKEGREQLGKVAAEDGGNGADEVARRADERGIVLRLLAQRLRNLGVLLVVDLAGSLTTEDEVEVGAEGLNVWRGREGVSLRALPIKQPTTYSWGR